MSDETVTESFYVLRRDTENPYLAVNGRSFTTLEPKPLYPTLEVMKFSSMTKVVRYLKYNNPPDVTEIVRVNAVVPKVEPTFRTEVVK